MRQLVPGGVLAVQMPRNFDAPSHILMRETAAGGTVGGTARPVAAARSCGAALEIYYDRLIGLASAGIDLWETEYLHILAGAETSELPVLAWVRGTALLAAHGAAQRGRADDFAARYDAKLRRAYPRRANGKTLFPFRRLFLVARG